MAKRSTQQQATRVRAKSDPQGSTKLAFVTGIFVGLIAATGAFLLWPSVSAPEPYLEDVGQFAETTSQRVTETIDWSFYDLFPKAEVATVGGYQQPMAMVGDATLTYYLQVGSFPPLAMRTSAEPNCCSLDSPHRLNKSKSSRPPGTGSC